MEWKAANRSINGRPQYGTARFIDPVILCPIRRYFCIDRTPKAIFYAEYCHAPKHPTSIPTQKDSSRVPKALPYPIARLIPFGLSGTSKANPYEWTRLVIWLFYLINIVIIRFYSVFCWRKPWLRHSIGYFPLDFKNKASIFSYDTAINKKAVS